MDEGFGKNFARFGTAVGDGAETAINALGQVVDIARGDTRGREAGLNTQAGAKLYGDLDEGGKTAYDFVKGSTAALPSVAASAVNPVLGAVVMGFTSGGAAVNRALKEGKKADEAVSYGIMTCVFDAAAQFAMTAIPRLPGVQRMMAAAADKVDDVLRRFTGSVKGRRILSTAVRQAVRGKRNYGSAETGAMAVDPYMKDLLLKDYTGLTKTQRGMRNNFLAGLLTGKIPERFSGVIKGLSKNPLVAKAQIRLWKADGGIRNLLNAGSAPELITPEGVQMELTPGENTGMVFDKTGGSNGNTGGGVNNEGSGIIQKGNDTKVYTYEVTDTQYMDDSGYIKWDEYAPNGGFVKDTVKINQVLEKGNVIDRYGNEQGYYVSPDGTTYSERSLPFLEGTIPYHRYEVIKPIDNVTIGIVEKAFGQNGGGTQYQLPMNIRGLIKAGYLKEIK